MTPLPKERQFRVELVFEGVRDIRGRHLAAMHRIGGDEARVDLQGQTLTLAFVTEGSSVRSVEREMMFAVTREFGYRRWGDCSFEVEKWDPSKVPI